VKTIKVLVSGNVQGVGFRYFVKSYADNLKVSGYARNLPDGRVEALLQGDGVSIDTLLNHIKKGPRFSSVASVDWDEVENAVIQNGFVTG